MMYSNGPESGDPLEAELSALRPAALPVLVVSRIAAEVESDESPRLQSRASRPRVRWMIGALAAGLAASVVIAAFLRHGRTVPQHPDIVIGPSAPRAPLISASNRPITLATYRIALARSPEDALALLDRQPGGSPPDASPRAFGRLEVAGARGEADVP